MSKPLKPESNPLVQGLTSAAVLASRLQHGANVLTPPLRTPWWKLYLEKFDDPVIRILLVAAGIAIAAGVIDGAYTEGAGIFCAIILSTALAFINEYQAAKEFDLLDRSSDELPVRVIRDGQHTSIPRRDVVVGDFAIFETGQEIAADGELLEAVGLAVNESQMTGESEPAPKSVRDGSERAETPEGTTAYPAHRLMRGTIVAEGYGMMRVTDVGDKTEAGKTARSATEEDDETTPLGLQLEDLARFIGVAGFAAAAFLFATLTILGVIKNVLSLSPGQWRVAGLIFASVNLAGIRIWLPIVYDALDFLGRKAGCPKWLESSGWIAHLVPILSAAVMFGMGGAALHVTGLLPVSPEPLIPPLAAREFLRMFMVAVTVVVVAVPEGLAMSVTLCLAYSVRKMAATNNLVRNMHACETIGAATVICTDKTGTLTLNEMRVSETAFASFALGKQNEAAGRDLIFQAIAANSTADLAAAADGGVRKVLGNPTEGALLMWVESLKGNYGELRKQNPVIDRLTFSTEHKFMCSVVESSASKRRVLHIKGAPEVVLGRCSHILTESGVQPFDATCREFDASLKTFQTRGMRTLGFAFKECDENTGPGGDLKALSTGLTWLGFVAIEDPVRPDVPAAIKACRHAGIAVKIVTGDNANTACEIARQVGLWDANEPKDVLVNGPDFAAMSDADARVAAKRLTILARSSPHDKLRLVKLLKADGEVVAVTGDGSNDAPALNFASVGLSMGKSGTASAREASDIVLLDDSFNSIVSAIKWGRSLYDNIQRFIVFQLTINAAALGLMLLGPFFGVQLPLTVPQMLWINLIMDTLAALALASELPHDSVMDRTPRAKNAFIVTRAMAADILITAGFFLATMLVLISVYKRDGEFSLRESSIVFSVMVLLQFWNLFNARCFGRTSSALKDALTNKGFVAVAAFIVLGQIAIVQWGGQLFRTEPLDVNAWLQIFGATSSILIAGELIRWIKRLRTVGVRNLV
ncbi:MAG: calcium-translocating P-type ATPase, PMCA-type [Planctomycetota bacterium]